MSGYVQEKEKGRNILLIIFIFFVIVILFFHGFIESFINKNILKKNKINELSKISINISEDYQFELCNENILLYTNNVLRTFDLEGNKIYEEKINPSLYINLGQEGVTIYDRDNNKIFRLNEQIDKIWSLDYFDNISNIFNNDGYTFLFSKSSGNNEINIINREGNLLNKISSNDIKLINGYIQNDKNIVATGIDISRGILEGALLNYNLDGELLWDENFKNQIIQKIDFLNENIIVITDEVISNIKNDKLLWSKSLDNTLMDSLVYKDNIYILSDKTLSSISNTGRLNFKNNIEEKYQQLEINNEKLYLIGKNNIKVYNLKGNLISDYTSKENIKKALITHDKIVLLKENEIVIGKLNR